MACTSRVADAVGTYQTASSYPPSQYVASISEAFWYSNSPLLRYRNGTSNTYSYPSLPYYVPTFEYCANKNIPIAVYSKRGVCTYQHNQCMEDADLIGSINSIRLTFSGTTASSSSSSSYYGGGGGGETLSQSLKIRNNTSVTPVAIWYKTTYASGTGDWVYTSLRYGTNIIVSSGNSVIDHVEVIIGYGNGVTSVPANEFSGITTIQAINIGHNITSLGNYAFKGCTSLSSITYTENLSSFGYACFSGCTGFSGGFMVPEGITSIPAYCFCGCSAITNFDLNNVTSVYCNAFYNTYANFSGVGKISYLDEEAFKYAYGLTGNYVFNSLTYMDGEKVFYGTSPTALQFPVLETITSSVFESCFADEVNFNADVFTGEGSNILPDKTFYCCYNLQRVSGLDNITELGQYCFYMCDSFDFSSTDDDYSYPSGLENVSYRAFWGCSALTIFPSSSSLTNIGPQSFGYCTSLTTVSLPSSVGYIAGGAFSGCTNITSYYMSNSSPCTMVYSTTSSTSRLDTFSGITNYWWIYVPAGSYSTYTGNTNWGYYKPHIYNNVSSNNMITGTYELTAGYAYTIYDDNDEELLSAEYRLSTASSFTSCSNFTAFRPSTSGTYIFNFYVDDYEVPSEAFNGVSELKSVICNSKITKVCDNAFNGCDSLVSFSGEKVTVIDANAFDSCTSLNQFTSSSLTSIGDYAFNACISLPSAPKITENCVIGSYAFADCNSMEDDLVIKYTTTTSFSIGNYAFSGCTSLKSLYLNNTISSSYLTVGTQAFYNCGFESIKFNGNIKLGSKAFGLCTNLESIRIMGSKPPVGPSSSISSSNAPFYGVKTYGTLYYNIEDATLSSYITGHTAYTYSGSTYYPGDIFLYSNTSYSTYNLKKYYWNYSAQPNVIYYSGNTALSSTAINTINDTIGANISACTGSYTSVGGISGNWYKIIFNNEIRHIPSYLFSSSSPLSSTTYNVKAVYAPSNVDTIEAYAFQNLTSLYRFFGDGISTIDANAFSGCTYLSSVTFSDTALTISEGIFRGTMVSDLIVSNDGEITNYEYANNNGITVANDDSVMSIGDYAFYGSSLNSCNFINLERLGESSFANTNLQFFDFSEAILDLGKRTFQNCSSLIYIDFESSEFIRNLTAIPEELLCGAGSNVSETIDGVRYYGILPYILIHDDSNTTYNAFSAVPSMHSAIPWYGYDIQPDTINYDYRHGFYCYNYSYSNFTYFS